MEKPFWVKINQIKIPQPGQFYTAVAFGGMKDGVPEEEIAYVGLGGKVGVRRPDSNFFKFNSLRGATLISDIVIDPENYEIAYAVDRKTNKVYVTVDTGRNWVDITGNLKLQRPSSVELIKMYAGLRISLREGTVREVPLQGTATIQDLIDRVNFHTNGAVTAAIAGQTLVFTDNTAGASSFVIETLNRTKTVQDLFGLERNVANPATPGTLTTPNLLGTNLAPGTGLNALNRQDPTGGTGLRRTGSEALLVGGVEGVYRALNPRTATPTNPLIWTEFGSLWSLQRHGAAGRCEQ
jgi:hypothetical protein